MRAGKPKPLDLAKELNKPKAKKNEFDVDEYLRSQLAQLQDKSPETFAKDACGNRQYVSAALRQARGNHAKVGKVIRKEKIIHLGFTKDTARFRDCVAVIRNHFTSNGEPSWDLMDAAVTCHGKGLENNTPRYGGCVVTKLKNRN